MALCDTCAFFSESFDEFRQKFDDVIDGDKQEKHFCTMYDDHIPHNIYHKNGDCPFYLPKDGD